MVGVVITSIRKRSKHRKFEKIRFDAEIGSRLDDREIVSVNQIKLGEVIGLFEPKLVFGERANILNPLQEFLKLRGRYSVLSSSAAMVNLELIERAPAIEIVRCLKPGYGTA